MSKYRPVKVAIFLKVLRKSYGCQFLSIRGDHLKILKGVLHSTVVIKEKELRSDQVRYVLKDLNIDWNEFEQKI